MIIRCVYCGKGVKKYPSDIKDNKNSFCSRECSDKYRTDEYTPFRQFFNDARIRSAKKNIPFDITLEDVKRIYEQQNKLCKYTNWELSLKPDGSPNRISIDRIIPASGYTKENIQIVAAQANYAKNVWSESYLIDFCRAVTSNFSLTLPASGA